MLSTIDRYCAKRAHEGMAKQAPPCTKKVLGIIVKTIYDRTTTSSDYLDTALVAVLWYLYGRSSDAEQLNKYKLSIYPDALPQLTYLIFAAVLTHTPNAKGGVVYLLSKQVKTATQQGVSLVGDPHDCCICPLHMLGIAMSLQVSPAS